MASPQRKPFFSWREALLESKLAPTTKHVLLTLACHMNDLGRGCFPSVKTLARQTGLSQRGVYAHLRKAKDAGWIVASAHGLSGRGWKRNEYWISWPQGTEPSAVSPAEVLKEVQHLKARGTERSDTEVLHQVQPSTSMNTSVGKEPAEKRQAPSNGGLNQKEFSDVAYRLFAERYQGKKPTWPPKHFVQLAALLSVRPDLTVDEFSQRYKNFLGSPDLFHHKKGGSLAFFCSNYDEFMEPIAAANPFGGRYVNKAQRRERDNVHAAQGALRRAEERGRQTLDRSG